MSREPQLERRARAAAEESNPLPGTRDGRNVDPALGALPGEAGDLAVKRPEQAYPARPSGVESGEVSEERPGELSYYGLPSIQEPVWIWTIPAYFYVGGVAGASSALGAVAQLAAPRRLHGLVRASRWIGTAGDLASAALLISDLGRPSRFLNMLRVFRPSSPMSVGAWVLAASGACNTAAVALGMRHAKAGSSTGLRGVLAHTAHVTAGALGLPLAGYTAVLLTNTAVPLWQGAYRTLPVLFVASAAASAGAALLLWPSLDARGRGVARAFQIGGTIAELAAEYAVEREAGRCEPVVRPLRQGASGALWRAARVLGVAGLACALLPRASRKVRVAGAVLTSAGALALRAAVFYAGKASARDPHATFRQQREGLGAAEIMGVTAVASAQDAATAVA